MKRAIDKISNAISNSPAAPRTKRSPLITTASFFVVLPESALQFCVKFDMALPFLFVQMTSLWSSTFFSINALSPIISQEHSMGLFLNSMRVGLRSKPGEILLKWLSSNWINIWGAILRKAVSAIVIIWLLFRVKYIRLVRWTKIPVSICLILLWSSLSDFRLVKLQNVPFGRTEILFSLNIKFVRAGRYWKFCFLRIIWFFHKSSRVSELTLDRNPCTGVHNSPGLGDLSWVLLDMIKASGNMCTSPLFCNCNVFNNEYSEKWAYLSVTIETPFNIICETFLAPITGLTDSNGLLDTLINLRLPIYLIASTAIVTILLESRISLCRLFKPLNVVFLTTVRRLEVIKRTLRWLSVENVYGSMLLIWFLWRYKFRRFGRPVKSPTFKWLIAFPSKERDLNSHKPEKSPVFISVILLPLMYKEDNE